MLGALLEAWLVFFMFLFDAAKFVQNYAVCKIELVIQHFNF